MIARYLSRQLSIYLYRFEAERVLVLDLYPIALLICWGHSAENAFYSRVTHFDETA